MRVKVWRDGPSCRAAVSSLGSQQLSGGSVFIFDPGKGSYSTVSSRCCATFVSTLGLLLSCHVGVYTSILFGLPVRGTAKVKVQSSVLTSRMEVEKKKWPWLRGLLFCFCAPLRSWSGDPLQDETHFTVKSKYCCNQLYFAENEDWVKWQLAVAICPKDPTTALL